MNIDGKTVVLRGPAGKLARPDAKNTGVWGHLNKGWRGVVWESGNVTDSKFHHRAAKVANDNYTYTHIENNGLAGADATKHSTALDKQIYYKPDDDTHHEGYEEWRTYDGNENGAIEAQIEYNNDDGKYFAYPVAVELVDN